MDNPPPGAFVQPNGYDPLRHHPSDFFWFHVEPCFRPFLEPDLSTLDEIAPTLHAEIDPPLAQRLVAALLDEGAANSNINITINSSNNTSSSNTNHNLAAQRQPPLWLPGSLPCFKAFNEVYESRVRAELEDLGVLLPRDDDDENDEDDDEKKKKNNKKKNKKILLDDNTTSTSTSISSSINISNLSAADRIRLDAWNLRHLSAINSDALVRVHSETRAEVTTQKARRAEKRTRDNLEVAYLKKMIENAAKKNKSRFGKLLREMHPNHDMPTGTPIPGISASHYNHNHNHNHNRNHNHSSNPDHNNNKSERERERERDRERKKKKRKSSHHDRSKNGSNKLEVAKSKKVRD